MASWLLTSLIIIWIFSSNAQYIYSNDYILVQQTTDYYTAESFCKSEFGTNLASAHNADENTDVANLCDSGNSEWAKMNNVGCWIGLSDAENEGQWVWEDGTTFDYSNWEPTQPDNNNNEDCVEINWNAIGKWNDDWCIPTDRKKYFVCNRYNPTLQPTLTPTADPTLNPSMHPSYAPTVNPTHEPTSNPTNIPSLVPNAMPTTDSSSSVVTNFVTSNYEDGGSNSKDNSPNDFGSFWMVLAVCLSGALVCSLCAIVYVTRCRKKRKATDELMEKLMNDNEIENLEMNELNEGQEIHNDNDEELVEFVNQTNAAAGINDHYDDDSLIKVVNQTAMENKITEYH